VRVSLRGITHGSNKGLEVPMPPTKNTRPARRAFNQHRSVKNTFSSHAGGDFWRWPASGRACFDDDRSLTPADHQ